MKNNEEHVNAATVETAQDKPQFRPDVDIYEAGDKLILFADLPGVNRKDLDISVEDKVLSITAAKAEEKLEGYELLHEGFRSGVYRRNFSLPYEVDSSKIEAGLAHGVLKIVMHKAEAAKPKKIEVKAG